MTLHIHNPEAGKLAHELAVRTGQTIDEVVLKALREQASHVASAATKPLNGDELYQKIMEISNRCAALPDSDSRSSDEIIGYDKNGLPL